MHTAYDELGANYLLDLHKHSKKPIYLTYSSHLTTNPTLHVEDRMQTLEGRMFRLYSARMSKVQVYIGEELIHDTHLKNGDTDDTYSVPVFAKIKKHMESVPGPANVKLVFSLVPTFSSATDGRIMSVSFSMQINSVGPAGSSSQHDMHVFPS